MKDASRREIQVHAGRFHITYEPGGATPPLRLPCSVSRGHFQLPVVGKCFTRTLSFRHHFELW